MSFAKALLLWEQEAYPFQVMLLVIYVKL
jgi:hypothetical protein